MIDASNKDSALPSLPASSTCRSPEWGLVRRFGFRFVFIFWLLFGYPIVGSIPSQILGQASQAFSTSTDPSAHGWFVRSLEWASEIVGWPVGAWIWVWIGASEVQSAATAVPTGTGTSASDTWHGAVPWLAEHIGFIKAVIERLPPDARDPRPQFQSGSGDQLFNWLEVGCFFTIALVGAAVWSVVRRKPCAYPYHSPAARFLNCWVRLLLIATMFGYGLAKVFPSQFPTPFASRLIQPYGESSPMGILWTFMGASPAYTIFAGAMEFLGGALLMFRRTTLLGALVVTAVMTNVFVLNMCYDVPVKLYSFMYLLAAVWVTLPDLPRLVNVVVLNCPAAARKHQPIVKHPALVRSWFAAKWLMLAGLLATQVHSAHRSWTQITSMQTPQGIDGLYVVDSFKRDGTEAPPLVTDGTRWKRININTAYGAIGIRGLNDVNQRFSLVHDADKKLLTLKPMPGKAVGPSGEVDYKIIPTDGPVTFTYAADSQGKLNMQGTIGGTETEVRLTRLDGSKFLLLNRGFHWVSQYPFNR